VGALLGYFCAKAINRKERGTSETEELEMLRAVVASLPDVIYVKDARSRFLFANQGTLDAMGAQSSADLLNKTDFDFYPKELALRFFEDERKVVLSGQQLINQEEYIKDSNGHARWLLTTKVPFLDAAGQLIGIIGIGRNITAQKDVEVELRQAREELEFKATHDSLTSLFNHGAILETLARELSRATRENTCTAVLMGDLDHFKEVNDLHGHPVGDEVLCEVAHRLLGKVRDYDQVGRYGGEEFLLVLPNCGAADALVRAEQLRQTIAASPIQTAWGPVPMSISFGVLVTQGWERLTSATVLREVDVALYKAKSAGRNRCACTLPPANLLAIDKVVAE
jgi:diguanylate cyclase (GGDEF)-like protein/PAS domain S-box-containing protein